MSDDTDWIKPRFSGEDVEVLGREELYRDFFRAEKVQLRHRLFAGDWSGAMSRELLLRGEAVAVLLYDPKRDLVGLIEQFRAGVVGDPSGPWCMEVVAGMVEAGESPEDVARRELEEEAGITEARLEYICRYYPSPGASDERLHLYCALADLNGEGGIHGLDDEHEDIQLHILPAEAVLERLYEGRFNNAAVLLGLQWLKINRSDLQARELDASVQTDAGD